MSRGIFLATDVGRSVAVSEGRYPTLNPALHSVPPFCTFALFCYEKKNMQRLSVSH